MNSHQTVLSLHPNQVPNIGQVLFTQDNVEAGEHPESLYIDETVWEEMGEPMVVTITVVVGDQLNDVDEEAFVLHSGDGTEVHRSAVTGQFVSEEFAEENPDTTVTES